VNTCVPAAAAELCTDLTRIALIRDLPQRIWAKTDFDIFDPRDLDL